jgi:ATP/ADP translocase
MCLHQSLSAKDASNATSSIAVSEKQDTDTFLRRTAPYQRLLQTVSQQIHRRKRFWHVQSLMQRINYHNPRVRACIFMAVSMSLHYSGYEFVRNAGLALFTSSDFGFPQASAFPLANGLISPISVVLLYLYSRQLEAMGPRFTLRNCTVYCIAFILFSSLMLWQCSLFLTASTIEDASIRLLVRILQKAVIGVMFLFNNSYVFMLASQQWSFIDSIVTPDEGAQWFGILTGVCSLTCAFTAGIVPMLLSRMGLITLYALTAVTLYGTLICGDVAYQIAQENGFDPALQREDSVPLKKAMSRRGKSNGDVKSSRISDTIALFRRVPTLRALFLEGISFQSLGTVLNVAMVRALKIEIPNDVARSAFTGRFYALVSIASAILQFVALPLGMKRLEPKQLWRIMPILPILVSLYQVVPGSSVSLYMVSFALLVTKILDYSVRVVIYNMAYQPLDFESRFVGKEVIGVFGGRFGRSGMSLFLSGLTASGFMASSSLRPLSYFSLGTSTIWGVSSWWLSNLLPSKADAQTTVMERRKKAESLQARRQKDE